MPLSKKQFAELLRGLPADASDEQVHLAANAAEQGTPLENIWRWLNKPLVGGKDSPFLAHEHGPDEGVVRRTAEDLGSSLTSPLNAGTIVAGLGAAGAGAKGLLGVSRVMRGTEAALQAPAAIEGVRNAIEGETPGERIGGAVQAGLGMWGVHSSVKRIPGKVTPTVEPPTTRVSRGEFSNEVLPQGDELARGVLAPGEKPPTNPVPATDRLDELTGKFGGRGPALNAELFTHPEHSPLANGEPFSILSGENPQGTVLTDAENLPRHQALLEDIKKLGYTPLEQQGHFGGNPERSVLTPGMPAETAVKLGKKYDQHSVITHEGLHRLGDDQLFPRTRLDFDQAAEKYYSEIQLPGGPPVKYQMAFPDEAFGSPSPSEIPAGGPASGPSGDTSVGQTSQPSPSLEGNTATPNVGMGLPNVGTTPKEAAQKGAELIMKGVTPTNWAKLMLGAGVPKESLAKIRAAAEKLAKRFTP